LGGCFGAYQVSPDDPLSAGGLKPTQEDKDAGRVGIAGGFNLKDYPMIAVERFPVAKSEIEDAGDQRFADRMATFYQSELVRRFRETGLFSRVVNLSDTDFPTGSGKALRLRGTITRLGRGSQAARYLVGFGAGSTRAQAETHFIDAESGRVLIATADRRMGSMGLFGGDSEDFLRESFDNMARDLARFVSRLAATAPATPSGPSADLKWPPVGSSYVVSERTSGSYGFGTRQQTTTFLGERDWQGKKALAASDGSVITYLDARRRILARVAGDTLIESFEPYSVFVDWPIFVGKSWRNRYRYHDHARGRSFNDVQTDCAVEAYEDVVTPAGTFKAFRIALRGVSHTTVLWYSNDVGFVVKTRSERWANHYLGRGVNETELLSYNLNQ